MSSKVNPMQRVFEEQVLDLWPWLIICEWPEKLFPGRMVYEYQFSSLGDWALDAAIRPYQHFVIALEFHGGKYVKRKGGGVGGGHHSGPGRARDMLKLREANLEGMIAGEFEWPEVGSGQCLDWLRRVEEKYK